MRRLPLACQLLLQRLPVFLRVLEYAVPIPVHRCGDATSGHDTLHELEVALGVLFLPEESMGDLAGGIVYRAYQAEPWPPVLQPIMRTAVHLQEHAL